jgi:hypothetical protein
LNWFWKTLIVLSLAMNLAGFGAQLFIIERALDEFWAQIAAMQGLSSDQQALRRQVNALEESCAVANESPNQ